MTRAALTLVLPHLSRHSPGRERQRHLGERQQVPTGVLYVPAVVMIGHGACLYCHT